IPAAPASAALSFDAATTGAALARVCRPRPVYHASSRISSEHIHETILSLLDEAGDLPDILPEEVREARHLLHRADAFRAVHDPGAVEVFRHGIATLRYEEAFVAQTALLRSRHDATKAEAWPCPVDGAGPADATAGPAAPDPTLRDRFIASLPFDLTGGQREVIDAIGADMARDYPMQRLLQGEVGSGKTVVALAAMLQAVGAGHQAVLVAPTQVLAEQHAATIAGMLAKVPPRDGAAADGGTVVPVVLLTGGMKLAARRKAMAVAASGEPCVIVATHAAFSKTFQAPRLALVVIDEQHRFGVEQRESLRTRGEKAPHLLVMTATPIPRTAAMTWFGDLDISWLTELPGGRKPIRTVVVREEDGGTMGRMFAHIRARIDAGERAYIVCARIDDTTDADDAGPSETRSARSDGGATDGAAADLDPYADPEGAGEEAAPRPPLHTVAQIAERLQRLPQFQGVRFATLTGRDKDEVKQQVMAGFASGETPVLVATTVIEVGVDVPQASCIVIFDADRYGLSQLHQLRGRVGRGGTNSWAFLVSRAESGSPAEQRLEVIRGTLDGAEIAQADLEFRGAGDVLGDAQSGGKSGLKLLRVVKDADLIADARRRAGELLERDPDLAGEVELAGAVLDFTRGNETFLTSS
ncbi:ATP-dependent DNA helicase RecG, partial [Bifidobacterium pullorum subsp. saeculare]